MNENGDLKKEKKKGVAIHNLERQEKRKCKHNKTQINWDDQLERKGEATYNNSNYKQLMYVGSQLF